MVHEHVERWPRRRRCRGLTRLAHSVESANTESRPALSTRSSRVPGGKRWQHDRVDPDTIDFLRSRDGSALLASRFELPGLQRVGGRRTAPLRVPARTRCRGDDAGGTETQGGDQVRAGRSAAVLHTGRARAGHASPRRCASRPRVVATGAVSSTDLGCGIGADLLAFARTGTRVSGVDSPSTAAIAQANLDAVGARGRVKVGDATAAETDDVDVVFADPAGGRPEGCSIRTPFLRHGRSSSDCLRGEAVVKLAPGLPHDWIPNGVEAEWVSLDGQLREAVLWSGRAVDCERRATVLRQHGDHVQHSQLTDTDDPATTEVKPVGRYVYEPDDAVIRLTS